MGFKAKPSRKTCLILSITLRKIKQRNPDKQGKLHDAMHQSVSLRNGLKTYAGKSTPLE